jgi:hypothetical protein
MEIIQKLENTKAQTLEFFELTQTDLAKSYGPGKWTVKYILHHLADAEMVLFERIRRVISEPRQVIWAFDQDAWARKLDYANMPLDLSRHIFAAVRDGIIHDVRLHYDNSGQLEFVHSETGVRTLKDEFDKVASHNEDHLKQIRRALGSS